MTKTEELERIDLYINEVSRLLPYPNSIKKEALEELRIDVQSAMTDSNGESPTIVFGNPIDVAKDLSQSHNWYSERAGWIARFLAYMIDWIFIILFFVVYVGGGFLIFTSTIMSYEEMMNEFSKWDSSTFDWNTFFSVEGIILTVFIAFIGITTIIGVVGYNIILEQYFGATLGKKVIKLTVVDLSGVKITWKQALIRNLSKILVIEEILPFDVLLGWILERLKPESIKKQRGLDVLAETIVIRQK